jgi:hypothetical protein
MWGVDFFYFLMHSLVASDKKRLRNIWRPLNRQPGAHILSVFLSRIEDCLGGIKIVRCLEKLLENVFL